MYASITIRPARQDDCSHLALFNDAATRRLSSHLWGLSARTGQSAFEVGRTLIATATDHFSHYGNWSVAEAAGQVAGGLNGWALPVEVPTGYLENSPPVTRPLNALKMVAGGTWYIVAAAVFPEYRGQGIGEALLTHAGDTGRAKGFTRLTLMVGSFNTDARRLYQRLGFTEWERRPFTPFPGSDPDGEWILMGRDL